MRGRSDGLGTRLIFYSGYPENGLENRRLHENGCSRPKMHAVGKTAFGDKGHGRDLLQNKN